jgi:hypothetical protein
MTMDAATRTFVKTPLFTDDITYRLIHLPPRAIWAAAGVLAEIGSPVSALVADKDEVTLLLPDDMWRDYANRLSDWREGGEYRLITFDQVLDPALVGFLALVARVLADTGVPLLALSAFERDHVLVPAAQFHEAWAALETARARLAGAA